MSLIRWEYVEVRVPDVRATMLELAYRLHIRKRPVQRWYSIEEIQVELNKAYAAMADRMSRESPIARLFLVHEDDGA